MWRREKAVSLVLFANAQRRKEKRRQLTIHQRTGAAHVVGHLLGLPDTYKNSNGVTTGPNTLMGAGPNMKITDSEIDAIANNALMEIGVHFQQKSLNIKAKNMNYIQKAGRTLVPNNQESPDIRIKEGLSLTEGVK